MEALGLIETKGFLGAVVAADTAVKAANVTLIAAERIRGGYVTVQLDGDVGAVKAAVEAATQAIEPFGTLISSHVIPRMHAETTRLIKEKNTTEEQKKLIETKEQLPAPSKHDITDKKEEQKNVKEESKKVIKPKPFNRKELEEMTVPNLRKLAREQNVGKDGTDWIKSAKKANLINRLLEGNKEEK